MVRKAIEFEDHAAEIVTRGKDGRRIHEGKRIVRAVTRRRA